MFAKRKLRSCGAKIAAKTGTRSRDYLEICKRTVGGSVRTEMHGPRLRSLPLSLGTLVGALGPHRFRPGSAPGAERGAIL